MVAANPTARQRASNRQEKPPTKQAGVPHHHDYRVRERHRSGNHQLPHRWPRSHVSCRLSASGKPERRHHDRPNGTATGCTGPSKLNGESHMVL
jgi:hypothetical protein